MAVQEYQPGSASPGRRGRRDEPPFVSAGRIGAIAADDSGQMIQATQEEARVLGRASMARP